MQYSMRHIGMWLMIFLSVAYVFYPIASVPSVVGGMAFVYCLLNRHSVPVTKTLIVVAVWTMWLLLSAIMNRDMMFVENTGAWFRAVKMFFIFIFLISVVNTEKCFWRFSQGFLALGAIYTFIGYLEVLFPEALKPFFLLFRARGGLPYLYDDHNGVRLLSISRQYDPNYVGFLLVLLTSVALAMAMAAWKQGQRIKYIYFGLVFFLSGGVILTSSRGAFLVLLFTLITTCVLTMVSYNKKVIKRIIVFAIVAVLAVGGISVVTNSFLVTKTKAMLSGESLKTGGSDGMRIEMVMTSWEMIRDNPVFGVGVWNYYSRLNAPDYAALHPSLVTYQFRDPHNFILSVGLSSGITGVLLVGCVIVNGMLLGCGKFAGGEENLQTRVLLNAFLYPFIYNSFFEYSLLDVSRLMLLYVLFFVIGFSENICKAKTCGKHEERWSLF